LFKGTDVLLIVIFGQLLFTLALHARTRACYILSAYESSRAIYRWAGKKKRKRVWNFRELWRWNLLSVTYKTLQSLSGCI